MLFTQKLHIASISPLPCPKAKVWIILRLYLSHKFWNKPKGNLFLYCGGALSLWIYKSSFDAVLRDYISKNKVDKKPIVFYNRLGGNDISDQQALL